MQIKKAEFVKSVPKTEGLPKDSRPMVALVGRSNVGKSSLINTLTGKKGLSRVSGTPGRTQFINLFSVNDNLYLIDLPGYGYAKTGKAQRVVLQEMIHDFLANAERLKLAIVIVDARIGLTDLDRDMLDLLGGLQIPVVIAANKIDGLSRTAGQAAIQKIEAGVLADVVPVSSVTGAGRDQLWEHIQHTLC